LEGLGERLRAERDKAGLSQRQLANRLGLSPSMISQVERGTSQPSVGTLWAIVTELNISLDRVIRGPDFSNELPQSNPATEDGAILVLHPENRKAIDLASGVRWEDLGTNADEGVDFVLATYEVGGASTPDKSLMQHDGREYGYVMTGTLVVQIDFQTYVLQPGDAISFDSTLPHRLYNTGETPVQAVWFVFGRRSGEEGDRGVGHQGESSQ
jgi:transcriptional regulator with XRE-family HTH domain